jgi:hypothetical protein
LIYNREWVILLGILLFERDSGIERKDSTQRMTSGDDGIIWMLLHLFRDDQPNFDSDRVPASIQGGD